MCDEWCCIGFAALSPPLIVTSPKTKGRTSKKGKKILQHTINASFHQDTQEHTHHSHTHTDTVAGSNTIKIRGSMLLDRQRHVPFFMLPIYRSLQKHKYYSPLFPAQTQWYRHSSSHAAVCLRTCF